MKMLRKNHDSSFSDNIFFSIPNEEPFSLDVPVITEYISLFKLSDSSRGLGIMILLENPDVKSFVDAVLTRFEKYKLIKRKEDRKFTKGENYHLAYDLGGYTAYKEFRKRELNFPKFQRRINRWLIVATIFSAASAPITAWINNITTKQPILKVPPIPQSPQIVVRFDSLSLIELKRLLEQKTTTTLKSLSPPIKK